MKRDEMEKAIRDLLIATELPESEIMSDTAERVAKAWEEELLSGYAMNPSEAVGELIPATEDEKATVVMKGIKFHSMCSQTDSQWQFMDSYDTKFTVLRRNALVVWMFMMTCADSFVDCDPNQIPHDPSEGKLATFFDLVFVFDLVIMAGDGGFSCLHQNAHLD